MLYFLLAVAPNGLHTVCAVAFCTRKNTHTYLKFFEVIREALDDPAVAPETLLMDQEAAAISAYRKVFYDCPTQSHIQLCFFHLVKAIKEKAAELGLRRDTLGRGLFRQVFDLAKTVFFVNP